MRNRLHKFTEFTGQLLPHETAYIMRTQQLEDPERLAILQRVDLNCRQEEVFLNEEMDGLNRYLALVRLIFIGFNYQNYDRMLAHFDYLDQSFLEGRHYSLRILANYYGNRLLLHSQ